MIVGRKLVRDEVERVWEIDRSEVIEHVYYQREGGLVLVPEHYDMKGWPPGTAESSTPMLLESFDHGGWFYGLFDGDHIAAVAVLDTKRRGPHGDQLQLMFLHVGRPYRSQGLGRRLFELASGVARQLGARALYVSATPSENTIRFYLARGCNVTASPDPELLALEPDDIHLVCPL